MRKPILVLLALAVLSAGCRGSIDRHIKSRAHPGEKLNSAVALVVNGDLKTRKLNGIDIGEGWINLLNARLAQYFDYAQIIEESNLGESGYYDLWVFPRFHENGEEFQLQLVGKTSPYGRPVISTDVMGCALHKTVDVGQAVSDAVVSFGLYVPFIPSEIVKANKETVANIETALAESTEKLVAQLGAEVKRNGFTSKSLAKRRAGAAARIELRTDGLTDTVSGIRADKGRYKRNRKRSFAK